LAAPAHAQQRPKVFIDNVQVGFTATAEEGDPADPRGRLTLYKAGVWTPVYVYLRAGPDGIVKGKVQVETTDSDDVQNTYTVPLPPAGVPPDEPYLAILYTKTGSVSNDFVVTVQADNKTVEQKKSFDGLEPGYSLCIAVGSRLPGLRQALRPLNASDTENMTMERTRVAYVDDVRQLPTRWFGFSAAELMVLTTGTKKFVEDLKNDDKNRKEALAEWVRRGGRLVVSCGRNRDIVKELFDGFQIPLPVTMTGALPVESARGVQNWTSQKAPLKPQTSALVEEGVRLQRKPGSNMETLLQDRDSDSPLVVRWPHGTGQVILIAVDLDNPPFTAWPGQSDFWKQLVSKIGLKQPVDSSTPNLRLNPRGDAIDRDDLASRLRSELENFKDVSVISFGWVALFILIYIIIVGPLDYLFLKKVVKRLELTWITFPAVVLLVSGGAYFTAYALKGNDLRINKVDVIDIDPATGRVYGNTWFTLFSPRIQLYTVGIEPATPDWSQQLADGNRASGVTMSWMGKPDTSYSGYGRRGSQSLFRRTYDYEPDGAGLTGVPIQVWSTKSFTASWERPFAAAKARSRLTRRKDGAVEGSVTNPLPVNLEGATLIYVGGPTNADAKIHALGTMAAGDTKPLLMKDVQTLNAYFSDNAAFHIFPGQPVIEKILFFSFYGSSDLKRDSALYYLDQGWRRQPGGAILVGRIARMEGAAETITQDPAVPTQLWLGDLPSGKGNRPALAGTLRQDTYVRVFLPVAPAPQ
jgi:hypothetical protein